MRDTACTWRSACRMHAQSSPGKPQMVGARRRPSRAGHSDCALPLYHLPGIYHSTTLPGIYQVDGRCTRALAACTHHRTVLATTVEPADDLWLCDGLRFEARTSMCLPCVCSVAERNADIATVWKALSLWRLFCRCVCVRYPGSTVELESHLGCTGPPKLLYLHLV